MNARDLAVRLSAICAIDDHHSRHGLHGEPGNGSSEAIGWLLDHPDARPSEEKWLSECVDAVQEAGLFAAYDAMAAKAAELIDHIPPGLVDGPKPCARELLGLDR